MSAFTKCLIAVACVFQTVKKFHSEAIRKLFPATLNSANSGGIHRYYELRRRVYNDSQLRTAAKVAEAKRNKKKRQLRKQVLQQCM